MSLSVLYPENENDLNLNSSLNLDIVAVHGLNGDSYRTWTCHETKKMWLQDFLPADLPYARIMTYNYNAAAIFQNSVADIKDHARQFLHYLSAKREGAAQKRPLVLVAHSLGGIVVKQALILASTEPQYRHIFGSAYGVIFFGTPHQGSDLATYGKTLARVPSALAMKPSPELLDSLMKSSPKLKVLTDNFLRLLEIRPLKIVSFYETRPLLLMRSCVVPRDSALLTPADEVPIYEHQIPVDADHRKMCQFSTPNEITYKKFVRSVKEIIRGDEVEVENIHFMVPQAGNLNFTGRNDIREQLKNEIVQDRHMRPKVQDRSVLYGLGGSGKTQISLKFAADHREKFWGIFWIDATSSSTARQSFHAIARACKQKENMETIKTYLTRQDKWLLIIDNADNPAMDLTKLFPDCNHGTILITTRNPDVRKHATAGSYLVDQMCPEDGVKLLLKTSLVEAKDEVQKENAREVVKILGYLALAIVQAGAVIRMGLCSMGDFCKVYASQKKELLELGPQSRDYPYSVYTTWEISLAQIKAMSKTSCSAEFALELLQTFAFMHFDGITEEIFERARKNADSFDGVGIFGKTSTYRMMPSGWNVLTLRQALKILVEFSLITVNESQHITIHPLVHEWSRERLNVSERLRAWEMAVSTLGMSTSEDISYDEQQYRRALLPHVSASMMSAENQDRMFAEGVTAIERIHIADKLITAYEEDGQYLEALTVHEKVLKLKEVLQKGDLTVSLTMIRIANCLVGLCKYKKAMELRETILQLAKERSGNNEILVLQAMTDLSWSYNLLGEYQKAYDLSIEVTEKLEGSQGPNDLKTMQAKSSLASCLYYLRRYQEAAHIQESLLAMYEELYTKNHPRTLVVMESLAVTYEALGMRKQARELREHTALASISAWRENHPSALQVTLTEVGTESLTQKRLMGLQNHKKILLRMQESLGDTHINTLRGTVLLAKAYLEYGHLRRSKELWERAIPGFVEIFGEGHPETLDAKTCLARCQRYIKIRKVLYWWVPRAILDVDGKY